MAVLSYLPKLKWGLGLAFVAHFLIQTVDDVINFKISLGSTSKAMVDREKKWGRQKYKNVNILRIKRTFQMKYKTFFIVFEGLLFEEK